MKKFSKTARKTARIAGALLLILVATIAIGDLAGDEVLAAATFSVHEKTEFVALGVMLFGLLLAYWQEFYGGLTVVLGYLTFTMIEYLGSGRLMISWVFITFLVVGLIYMTCSWIDVDHMEVVTD